MNPQILQYAEVEPRDWDNFVHSSSLGYAHLLYDVIAIDRWEHFINLSFAVLDKDKDELCMVSQLHLEKYESDDAVNRLHSRWGLAYKDNLPRKEFNKLRTCYIEYIDSLIEKYNAKSFENSFSALSDYNQPPYVKINPGIWFGFQPNMRYTSVIDLKKDDLLVDCEQTTRAAIRKISSEDKYDISEVQSNECNFQIYDRLLKETYTRSGAASIAIPESYNRNIFFKLLPKGISRVFFLRNRDDGENIATVCILFYHNTAYYWWGGSKSDCEVGVNKYLLFKVIEIIKNEYAVNYETYWFETGATYPYVRAGKQKGLSDYKKSFGTFLHPILSGHYVINRSD